MVRAFRECRSERKKRTTSGSCPQFPKRFSGKLPFHLTLNRNFRIFWLNGKHPLFKKWRQLRQRQRHKTVISLVKRGKNKRAARAARILASILADIQHNDVVKSPDLRIWLQREYYKCEPFILCVYFWDPSHLFILFYFANIVLRERDGITAKAIFLGDVLVGVAVVDLVKVRSKK